MNELALYFAQALLVELDKQIIQSTKYFPASEFLERIRSATRPAIPEHLVGIVIGYLEDHAAISVIKDDVVGDFIKLEYWDVHNIVAQGKADKAGFIYRYSQVGSLLLERILEKLEGDAPEHAGAIPTTADPFEEVPASDRIVSRNDNLEAIGEIKSDISELRRIIKEDNEVGAEIGDAREIVDFELEVADSVLERPRFRLKSLLNWLLPALSFLADKFAGGAIAELAKRLVTALLGLSGLH